MENLRTRIESLGVPLILMRKFIQLAGAISVQVEDEFTSRRVIDTVFVALAQQAEEIRKPESDQIKAWISRSAAWTSEDVWTRGKPDRDREPHY